MALSIPAPSLSLYKNDENIWELMATLKHKFVAIRVIYSINIKTYRKIKIFYSGRDGMYKAIFKDKVHIKMLQRTELSE